MKSMSQKSRLNAGKAAACLMIAGLMAFTTGVVSFNAGAESAGWNGSTFTSDFTSREEVIEEQEKLNEEITAEGFVLMKNEDKSLPLRKGSRISVFGKNSADPVYGSAGSTGAVGEDAIDLYSGLENAGFSLNPKLKEFYKNDSLSGKGRGSTASMGDIPSALIVGETPKEKYTSALRDTYHLYNDAAVVVISRVGSEGSDSPRSMWDSYEEGHKKTDEAKAMDSHYLELTIQESDLLKEVCGNFENVVVLLNCSQPIECGFLTDPTDPDYHAQIKSALWISGPGESGFASLGKVLNGEVNPSGRLVDTYARDLTADPAYANFSNNNVKDGHKLYNEAGELVDFYEVEYEEGIYMGYRYWETRGFTDGEEWYDSHVVYPFGYGLSYTQFEYTSITPSKAAGSELGANDSVSVDVTVKNIGTTAGKEVVQLLYYTPQYNAGGIEKAHVVLGDFAKTKLLKPGESETVRVTLDVRDMASYDYSDANKNNFRGYELDAGTYSLKIMKNAHEEAENGKIDYKVAAGGIRYATDEVTENTIENRFDDVSGQITKYLSRNDWTGTFPLTPTYDDRLVTTEFVDKFNFSGNDEGKKWYTEKKPKQSKGELSYNDVEVRLYDLITWDKETGDVSVDYNDSRWDTLLNQLTLEQMALLIGTGNFNTYGIESIGKPQTIDPDGPAGFTNFMGDPSVYDTCFYASECVIAATYNKEIAYDMGRAVGNEGIWGNEKGGNIPYSGWYAPAVNLHRSPFSGRNWEYYSEDSLLSGVMGAQVVKGAKDMGVYTYVKHFALNDQETDRDSNGLSTWANEQSMRELYFKPFEYTVKEGGTSAMMSSFNRIGHTWAGGSYELLTEVLRNEWGFKGMVVTDYAVPKYLDVEQAIRAGGDLMLYQDRLPSHSKKSSATQVASMRRATKNILYTVAESVAMNGMGSGVIYTYTLPTWNIIMIVADCAIIVGIIGWGILVCRSVFKKKQEGETAVDKPLKNTKSK